jgi:hypothetical protein
MTHAVLMALWVLGLPLLFWRRWPAATRAFAVYAVAFVIVNLASRALLGECFLTTLARTLWHHAAHGSSGSRAPVPDEWFTVRAAQAIFRLTPSHQLIKRLSEILIFATAVGVLFARRKPSERRARGTEVAPQRNREKLERSQPCV